MIRHPRLEQRPARRRVVIAAVSLATAAWLSLQLLAGLSMRNGSWPVPGFPMFRQSRSAHVEPRLVATTESGRTVTIPTTDFGLTRDQLANYLLNKVVDRNQVPHDGGGERLTHLATLWNRSHQNDPAVSMVVVQEVTPLPVGPPVRMLEVARWHTP
jgi:hypothetical protein